MLAGGGGGGRTSCFWGSRGDLKIKHAAVCHEKWTSSSKQVVVLVMDHFLNPKKAAFNASMKKCFLVLMQCLNKLK